MENNVVAIRYETSEAFFPADMQAVGAVNLQALAELAKDAITKSESSLNAARAIADGSWWDRFFKTGAMQQHVIQSITHIRDISKVNLGLSAICNDLAAANLENAQRIDQNHVVINQQLRQVQQLTGDLLEHLRRPREPSLLEKLAPALLSTKPTEKNEVQAWLHTMTEEIEFQYLLLKDNLDQLTQKNNDSVNSINQIHIDISKVKDSLLDRNADTIKQIEFISSRLTTSFTELDQRVEKTDSERLKSIGIISRKLANSASEFSQRLDRTEADIRDSKETLGATLTTLKQQLMKHQSDFKIAIHNEQTNREDLRKSIISMIEKRESAVRITIGELNQHLIKRILQTAGGLVVLQLIGFVFIAFKFGLLK